MYLHGAPAHADHFKQGDGFHISIFELFILCSAQAAITALWMLSLGIFRAFPSFSLSSLHTSKNTYTLEMILQYISKEILSVLWYVTCSWRGCFLVFVFSFYSTVVFTVGVVLLPQSSVCFHFSHLRRDAPKHRKRHRLLSSLWKQDAHAVVSMYT